jgi:hypothetical protein
MPLYALLDLLGLPLAEFPSGRFDPIDGMFPQRVTQSIGVQVIGFLEDGFIQDGIHALEELPDIVIA